ncbi:MAG: hypothetical protein JJ900_10845 [Rhodospirillales bacterium]|nr:hypothetical protein [Rhodospirillales bacterium]MBO6787337.1 hypothetical protein [Rhodospirillales bacterium]
MRKIILPAVALAALLTAFPSSARISVAECEADYAAMVAEIERNRESSLTELNRELRFTSDDEHAAALNHQIEQAWHMEEMFLGNAAIAYRDCVKYAESGGS